MTKTADVLPLLPEHLAGQRWYAGPAGAEVTLVAERELPCGERAARWLVVDAGGGRYQLLLGERPADSDLSFLHGSHGLVGVVDGTAVYDAVLDPELGLGLLVLATDGAEQAFHVRPVGAEQSNTSLVYDDRLILKLFRRLHAGPNPEVEVPRALAEAGFAHVAAPVSVWREDPYDLAVTQQFLAGAAEGWSLALTSLRDFYGSDTAAPEECGGDFAGEARRLGEVTAEMHLKLAATFGAHDPDAAAWQREMVSQLEAVAGRDPWAPQARERLAATGSGKAIRVHGDLHLGQVVRTDHGWFVLDFEGEPARDLDARAALLSPLKDVAGMVRSFHYAAQVVLAERPEDDRKPLEAKADAWELRNREAYLRGYLSFEGVLDLLPATEEARHAELDAWELDKAVYELAYERSHRPGWESIPLSAVERLLARDG
jgi:maltokinase